MTTRATRAIVPSEEPVIDTRVCYLVGGYISYQKAAAGHREALLRAGARLVSEPRHADVVILHDDILAFGAYFARYPELSDKYVVGYAVWEAEHLSDERRASLALVDEVWTPSTFCEQVLSAAHDRIVRVPHLVRPLTATEASIDRLRRQVGYQAACFYFYAILRASDPRKNAPALLEAFAEVHRDIVETRLIVKQYGRIAAEWGSAPGVVSIDEHLDDDAMAALHAVGDAYVSPHRAEGWGLCLADAMASGNPVIATDYSGSRDFMSELDGYPVAHRLVSATESDAVNGSPFWTSETRWAEVDHDALVGAMKSAWHNRAGDERRWRATAIVARYGIESLTRRVSVALRGIAGRASTPKRRPRLSRPRPVVGIFHRPDENRDVILGRVRAVGQLTRGYARFGKRFDYALFAPERAVEATLGELAARGPWMTVHGRRDLERRLARAPVDVWHDMQLDTSTPFQLRRAIGGRFPVTLVHHTISYRHLIATRWLPFLLARPRRFDSLICTSEASRLALEKLLAGVAVAFETAHGADIHYRGRLDVIPLGVDTQRFAPGDPTPARARLDIEPEAFVMLWVGRLSAVDKADLLPLVQAFAELRARHRRRLVLICCGTERKGDTLGPAIADYAKMLGVAADVHVLTDVREGLEDLYRAADVFVSPSDNLQESFGLAVIEAMASGLPQIVSDWNGHRDTVVDDETGFLVPTYGVDVDAEVRSNVSAPSWQLDHLLSSQAVAVDVRHLVSRLDELISDPERLAEMGRASRRRAVEQYDWRHVVAQHEALWAALIEQREREPEEPADLDYLLPNYGEVFAHYPTKTPADDTPFFITAHGRRVGRGEMDAPTHHHREWHYLDHQILRWLMLRLIDADARGASVSSGALAALAAEQHLAYAPTALRRHLMWLFKYDVVTLTAPSG